MDCDACGYRWAAVHPATCEYLECPICRHMTPAPYIEPSMKTEDKGNISDGYHTFNELYDHRCTLFLALMKAHKGISWISSAHYDGSTMDGWFVAGMELPTGMVTYHLPSSMWSLACETGAKPLVRAPEFDGHTSADVVKRIQSWIATP